MYKIVHTNHVFSIMLFHNSLVSIEMVSFWDTACIAWMTPFVAGRIRSDWLPSYLSMVSIFLLNSHQNHASCNVPSHSCAMCIACNCGMCNATVSCMVRTMWDPKIWHLTLVHCMELWHCGMCNATVSCMVRTMWDPKDLTPHAYFKGSKLRSMFHCKQLQSVHPQS